MKFDLNTIGGKHKLTGIGLANAEDGYVLEIDGKLYIIYEDYPDEYRSTCCIQMIGEEDHYYSRETVNRFTEQDVEIEIDDFDVCEYCSGIDIEGLKIINPVDKSVIFNAWTEDWHNYYPSAQFEYHPENLPINK